MITIKRYVLVQVNKIEKIEYVIAVLFLTTKID